MAQPPRAYGSPQMLVRLQSLFDEIWAELSASGSPHAAPEVADATRDKIAKLVVRQMGFEDPDVEKIKREILRIFRSQT
jgi:hypothetical protein